MQSPVDQWKTLNTISSELVAIEVKLPVWKSSFFSHFTDSNVELETMETF